MPFIIKQAEGDRLVSGLDNGLIGVYRAKARTVELWTDDGQTHLCTVPHNTSARELNTLARDLRLVHLGAELVRRDWASTHGGTVPEFVGEIERMTAELAAGIRDRFLAPACVTLH